jgi:hypothetical protein
MEPAPAAPGLLVQHDVQKRSVDLQATVVFDESQFSELVHEEIDARARFEVLSKEYDKMRDTARPSPAPGQCRSF